MLCDNIKKARLACGYTQSQIAGSLGIDRSTYAYYETGKSRPDVKLLIDMSVLFNISVEALAKEPLPGLLRDGTPEFFDNSPKSDRIYATLTPAEREIILKYRVLKAQNKTEEISKLLEFLEENAGGIE